MDKVEILNGLLAESLDLRCAGEPSSQDVVEILMEDIQSDDDQSEESDEPEEEERNYPIMEKTIQTPWVSKETIIKKEDSGTTLIKMETSTDCEVIATWEESDTTDRKVASSHIVPETRSQDDLMRSYHYNYSSSCPSNIIINQDDSPTTVLEDKIEEVTAENPGGGLLLSLLHTNVPVNLGNQGNTETCKNNEAETVTIVQNSDSTISNDTGNNNMSDCVKKTDEGKSLLFLLLTSGREEFKQMQNRIKDKYNSKPCQTISNSGSPQNDREIQENQNIMGQQNVSSFHKSKRKQGKNVFKPIGANNNKQRNVLKKRTINRRQGVDVTQKQGHLVLRNSSQKNESNNSPTLFHPTDIAATLWENLEVFKPIGPNNSKQRDVFEKKRTVNLPQGVDVTQIRENVVLRNSTQKNESNKNPTLFHPTVIAGTSSENLEVFEPTGTNNSNQRDVFEKKRTVNPPQGVDVTQIRENVVLRNSTQKNESNKSPTLFQPMVIASTSSKNLEVSKPMGTNNSNQRDVFEKKRTVNPPQGVDVTQLRENVVLRNSTQKNESNKSPTLFHPTVIAGTSSENLEVFENIGTNNSNQRDVFEKKRTNNPPQGVDVTQIPENVVLRNSTQKNQRNNSPTLFHPTVIAGTSSENLEVFEAIDTNISIQRDVFEKKRTVSPSQGVNVTQSNNSPILFQPKVATTSSETPEVFEPYKVPTLQGTNNSQQKDVIEETRTIDRLTDGVVDVTQIPGNYALSNGTQKNESNNHSPTKVASKTWENLAKMFQDAATMKNKQVRSEISGDNYKKKTTIRRKYTPRRNKINQESQENKKNTVSVGIHSKHFQNSKRKPEEVFETVGLDNNKEIDVSEKGKTNQPLQRVIVTEHFVLRNSMQKNDPRNLLENNVATPWVNLASTAENRSAQAEFGLINHKKLTKENNNMLRHKENVTESPILKDKTSMLFSLLNNGKDNQLEIGQENQQKVNPVMIHNTQNDVQFHNSKRKQANTQLGMFEYISMDSNERDVPKKNYFHHNKISNHTNLLEPNKDVDPLENLAADLLQNNGSTMINKCDQDQTDNMLENNTNIKQNQIQSNGSSMLFSLLNNERGENSCRNQPQIYQETQGTQKKTDAGIICGRRNEVISNNSKQGRLKILENVCIAKAHSQHRDVSEKERITNKQPEGKGGSVDENFAWVNTVDTAREYLDKIFGNPKRTINKQDLLRSTTKSFIEKNNTLAHQLSEGAASVLNEAKLPEVIRGQAVTHDSVLQRFLGENNQKTDNEKVGKAATSSKTSQKKEIHQKKTPQQSLINESRQQMNLNINHGKEVLVLDSVKDIQENIAVPKKTDILQEKQNNYTPVAVGKRSIGEVNRVNNIQANLVPVITNKGLIYCVVVPKPVKPNQEKKDGSNPWVEQINYRKRKKIVEQCVLIDSSEDEGSKDITENKKKKVAKINVLETVSHQGKQSEAVNSDRKKNLQQNVQSSGKQENELKKQNGDSVSIDNIYEDPFDCSSSSDGDILEDNSDMEFANEDEESGVKEVPKST